MRLRNYPCSLDGALGGSEGTWPKEQSTLEKAWAWVGQVDLFWTNIGENLLTWSSKITIKGYGIKFLVGLVGLVLYYIQINGNFDLTMNFTGSTIPTTLREIDWPMASCNKASFSLF